MAEGVENCCVLVCFLTPEYQQSINCKKELTYASELGKPIIPCIIGSQDKTIKWKPSQWLGLTITDLLYLNFTNINDDNFDTKCQELVQKISSVLGTTRSESSDQKSKIIEKEENDDEDFEIISPLIIPPIIRKGPQINDETNLILPKKYSSEGDSPIRLINQSTEIECNQDLYARNGRFFNSFTLSRFIFHNTSSESISILQLSAEYEDQNNKWIPCQIKTNKNEDIINIDPNKLVVYSVTIKIELNGSPGVDNQHRFRAHPLLRQPLRIKILIEDTQMKHSNLIIEQVNRPLNLPTLDKLIEKLKISESNILGFVWCDDCSMDVRYFVLVYYLNDENNLLKFTSGCDLSGFSSPSWDKDYVQSLQKKAKKENKSELIVHEEIFHSFINCKALFDQQFKLQAIQIKIKTNTSTTEQTIPLPIKQIFTQTASF